MGLFDRIFKGKEKGGASLTEEDATAVVSVPAAAVAATAATAAQEDATAVMPVSEESVAATATGVEPQQAVIVRFTYAGYELGPLFELQARLEEVVEEGRLGEVDGHEAVGDGGAGVITLYGPDADALFAGVRAVLEGTGWMKGAKVVVRYGGATDGAREKSVVVGG
ncbi:MAG: hypothetical protein JWO56_3220 [Acidobacteria bacterium]|nr:hypothetical protein [Acidobacteriota bacterium]